MKRYIIECVGTFFLAMAISFTGNPFAIGLMLAAMIYIGGHISGGNFNPAVSFSWLMHKSLTKETAVCYMGAQTGGALLALLLFKAITGNNFSLDINPEMPLWISILIETLLTAVFCSVIFTAVNAYKNHASNGLMIGLTLTAIAFIGGIFNPAIGLSSIILSMLKGGMESYASVVHAATIYVAAPLAGGALAALGFDYFNPPSSR